MSSIRPRSFNASMSPVNNPRFCSQLFLNSFLDGGEVRTGIANWGAFLHAGCKHDCLCSPVNHHLGSCDSLLAGTATTCLVTQKSALLSGSVRANIALADPDAA